MYLFAFFPPNKPYKYKKNMKKINYRLIFNKNKQLNTQNNALLLVKACFVKKKRKEKRETARQTNATLFIYIEEHK